MNIIALKALSHLSTLRCRYGVVLEFHEAIPKYFLKDLHFIVVERKCIVRPEFPQQYLIRLTSMLENIVEQANKFNFPLDVRY